MKKACTTDPKGFKSRGGVAVLSPVFTGIRAVFPVLMAGKTLPIPVKNSPYSRVSFQPAKFSFLKAKCNKKKAIR